MISCVLTTSKDFKRLQKKTGLGSGTLSELISQYQNYAPAEERGKSAYPSVKWIEHYARPYYADENTVNVWKTQYSKPRYARTIEDAKALAEDARKHFDNERVWIFKTSQGYYGVKVAQPVRQYTRAERQTMIEHLQSTVDSNVNNGAIYTKSYYKNPDALSALGRIEDYFTARTGLFVKASWNKQKRKYEVHYTKDNRFQDPNDVSDDASPITLNKEQKTAVDGISKIINDNLKGTGTTHFVTLQGKAGTGKTTIINYIMNNIEPNTNVAIGALSNKAKSVLFSKISDANKRRLNIKQGSIAKLLGLREQPTRRRMPDGSYEIVTEYKEVNDSRVIPPIKSAQVIFIDEASMVGEREFELLKRGISFNGKIKDGVTVVFIGDNGQLPPIRSSSYYDTHKVGKEEDSPVFQENNMPKFILSERVRQGEDSPVLAFADRYYGADDKTKAFPSNIGQKTSADGRLIIESVNGVDGLINQTASLFKKAVTTQNPNVVKIVTYTNAARKALNMAVRKALHPDNYTSTSFLVGDMVIFNKGYAIDNVTVADNSDEGIVTGTGKVMEDTDGIKYHYVTIKKGDGTSVSVSVLENSDANRAKYQSRLRELAAEAKAKRISWRYYFDARDKYADLDLGYAITSHKSQGSTYDVVVVDADNINSVKPITNKAKAQAIYTAVTRASNISIVLDDEAQQPIPNIDVYQRNEELNKKKGGNTTTFPYVPPTLRPTIDAASSELAKAIEKVTMSHIKDDIAANKDKLMNNPHAIIDYVVKQNKLVSGTKEIEDNRFDAKEVLRMIIDTEPNTRYAALAKAYLPLFQNKHFYVGFSHTDNKRDMDGHPAGRTYRKPAEHGGLDLIINVDSPNTHNSPVKTLLHEITHAVTIHMLGSDSKAAEPIKASLDEIINQVVINIDNSGAKFGDSSYNGRIVKRDVYGLYNRNEFVAEFMSNSDFQDMLKQMPTCELESTNFFDKMVRWITKLFDTLLGINDKKVEPHNLYEQLCPLVAEIVAVDEDAVINENDDVYSKSIYSDESIAVAREIVKAINGVELKSPQQEKKKEEDKSKQGEQAKEDNNQKEQPEQIKEIKSTDGKKITDNDVLKETQDKIDGYEKILDSYSDAIKNNTISNEELVKYNEALKQRDYYTDLLNKYKSNKSELQNEVEKRNRNAAPIEVKPQFNVTVNNSDNTMFTADVVINNIEGVNNTEKEKLRQLERMVGEEIPVSAIIKRANITKETAALLDKLSKKGYNKTVNGDYVVGLTEQELKKINERNNLFGMVHGKPLFTSTELRTLAKAAVFKLSEGITKLQTYPEAKKLLPENITNGVDFTKMSRIDIIRKVGLSTLMKYLVQEPIFNVSINRVNASKSRVTARKMKVIHDNFMTFMELGYDTLIGMEEISLTGKINAINDGKNSIDESNGETIDDKTEQEVQEIFGSSIEHWQVGFRQISAFNSLSQMIKRQLEKLYVLDKDGNHIFDEFGMAKTLESSEVVSKILHWTQYAESLDDRYDDGRLKETSMVYMLQQHMASNPWLSQLVGNDGMLVRDTNDQFKSQFFSNFKKYFQKYTVMYKDKGQWRMKVINDNPYAQSAIDNISNMLNAGKLTIWDKKTHKLTSRFEDLKAAFGVLERENLLSSDLLKAVKDIYSILDFALPDDESLKILFDPAVGGETALHNLKTLVGKKNYLIGGIVNHVKIDGENFNPFKKNGKAGNLRSDYKKLAELLSPVMGDNTESVAYEAGKLYYSYVTPSYMNKLIGKLKGNTADYNDFMNKEYKQYEGWFYNSMDVSERDNTPYSKVQGPRGWLNYWLNELNDEDTGTAARNTLEHVAMLSFDGVNYVNKTPVQYYASLINMYFYDDNGGSAYYRVPIESNKPSEEYIRFKRIKDNYEEIITDWLATRTYYQELNRIKACIERNAHLPKDKLIKNFDKNGTKFQFLDYLNDYVNDENSELGRLIRKQIKGEAFESDEAARFNTLLKEGIKESMNNRFEQFIKDLERRGFLTLDTEGNITKMTKLTDKVGTGVIGRSNLKEYFWNDNFATINILQLTVGDIAMYKNTEDLQKRLAQLHAPGIRCNVQATYKGQRVSDGYQRTMYLKDSVVKSEILSNLNKIVKDLDKYYPNLNADEQRLLRVQINNMIAAFKEVNVADAQGYSSPTAYRKKMVQFGKWDDAQESAYRAIKSGVFSMEDWNIAWQPLKPFVYSQINKPSHSDYLPNGIKTGVQNKNSEYLLIMADALMRGSGLDSTLSAIYDIMEKSQDDNPTKGIDTIQFESTVKDGLTGVISLDKDNGERKSKDEIEKEFFEKMYNADGSYNMDYVHEIPFEDYCLQQEIPKHFLDHNQAMGSQDRILTITDMPDKDASGNDNYITVAIENDKGKREYKRLTVAQAKEEYTKAIVDNINLSMEEVAKRFNLNGNMSEKMRNIALSRLLQDEITKDARYGTDLLWACSVDKEGNFNIPLSDPIQAGRIQQLLNSIIKNNINKQEIAGGPVVQVSSYGLSDELNIRFQDQNGKILLTESEFNVLKRGDVIDTDDYAGADSQDKFKTYQEYVDKYQDKVAYFECYVPVYSTDIIKQFGKPDGSIDVKAMEKANPRLLEMIGYRIPTESKYSMVPIKIKGFLPRYAGEGIMLPKEITTLSGSDFDIDKLYIMRYDFDPPIDHIKQKEAFIKSELLNKFGFDKADRNEKTEYAKYVSELLSKGKSEATNADTKLRDSKILDRWAKYDNYYAPKWVSASNRRAKNNNTVLALQWGFLTARQTEQQLFTPGGFVEPKRVGYLIAAMQNLVDREGITAEEAYNELKSKSGDELKDISYTGKSLLYANTQVQFHEQNMVAGKLIGVFAQANVSHGFVSLHNGASITVSKDDAFKFDGVSINDVVPIDMEYSLDGVNRISNVLASYLAASVDAVKDPILNLMNINMTTVNAAVALARLGFDVESIGLFLSHPAIVKLVHDYNIESAKGGYVNINKVLANTLADYDKRGVAATPNEEIDFNKEFFVKSRDDARGGVNDYNVLLLFDKVMNIAEDFRSIIHMTRYNSISSAVGPFASNTFVLRFQDSDFFNSKKINADTKEAARHPILRAFRDNADILEKELLGRNILQAKQDLVGEGLSILMDRLGYMNNKVAREFSNFFMSYYVNSADKIPVFDTSEANRSNYINNFPSDYITLKDKYIENHGDNALLDNIRVDKDTAGNPILVLSTRGMQPSQVQDITNAWADLYINEKLDGKQPEDNLAIKLVEYNFFIGTFGFSPKTFMSLVPDIIKAELPNYKDNLDISKAKPLSEQEMKNCVEQFMLNNDYCDGGKYEESDLGNYQTSEDNNGETLYVDTSTNNSKVNKHSKGIARVERKNDDGTTFTQYYYIGSSKVNPLIKVFIPIDKLGGNGQAIEMEPGKSVFDTKSVFTPSDNTQQGGSEDNLEDNTVAPKEQNINSFSDSFKNLLLAVGFQKSELNTLTPTIAVKGLRNTLDMSDINKEIKTALKNMFNSESNSIDDTQALNIIQKAEQIIKDKNICG